MKKRGKREKLRRLKKEGSKKEREEYSKRAKNERKLRIKVKVGSEKDKLKERNYK